MTIPVCASFGVNFSQDLGFFCEEWILSLRGLFLAQINKVMNLHKTSDKFVSKMLNKKTIYGVH